MTREWTPTEAERAAYSDAVECLRREGGQVVQVLCPRRHFIADVGVFVPEGTDDFLLQPRSFVRKDEVRWQGYAQMEGGPDPTAPKILLLCRKASHRYQGNYNFFKLAALLGVAAASGKHDVVLPS